jgi:6-phospho-beta-glucosidase
MGAERKRPVIAIVGGGVYVPRLCTMLSRAIPAGGSVRLSARRADRVAAIAAYADSRVARPWSVRAASSLEACVDGADAVVLLVRVGGLAARAHDESFPERFGLVGDEGLGPGGFANGFRTAPALAEMARVIRRSSANALVCNLVAPLGITTRILIEERLNAIGICELPAATLRMLTGGVAGDDGLGFHYAGLNHVGWFWDVRRNGIDPLTAAVARGLVDGDTLDRFGAAPLRYYYEVFDRDAGRRIGIERRSGRARQLADLAEQTFMRFNRNDGDAEHGARPTPWFDEALLPVLLAHTQGHVYDGFLNVANASGAVANLPTTSIVEVRACLRDGRIGPRPVTSPPQVCRFLARLAHAEALAYAAAREQDPNLLREALGALPLPIEEHRLADLVAAALAAPAPLEASA